MRIALAWFDLFDPTDKAVALGLSRALRARGHSPFLVGPKRRREDRPFQRVAGLNYHRVSSVRELKALRERERPELWHCHLFGRDHGLLGTALDALRPVCVMTPHLILADYARFTGGRAGLRALLRRAGRVTAVSRAALAELRTLAPELRSKSSAIYSYGPHRTAPRARARGPFILCASRLAPYKGVDILLMAFAGLARRFPDLRLLVCGRDQLRGGMSAFARKLGLEQRVRLTGEVSPARVRRWLGECLFLAVPSRRDNFPIILVEALAAGRTAVASRAGGIPEMIRHGREALLTPPGDAGSLARAMERLIRDQGLRRRLERGAAERAALFTWERAAGDYLSLYEDILG